MGSATTNGGATTQIQGTPRMKVGSSVTCSVEASGTTAVNAAALVKFTPVSSVPAAPAVPRTDTFAAAATGNGSITYTLTSGHGGTITLKFLCTIVA